jgi:hypothetical protein
MVKKKIILFLKIWLVRLKKIVATLAQSLYLSPVTREGRGRGGRRMTEQVKELIDKGQLPLYVLSTADKGRFLVASRQISPGEVVLKEVPYVAVVDEAKIQYLFLFH